MNIIEEIEESVIQVLDEWFDIEEDDESFMCCIIGGHKGSDPIKK